MSTIFTKIINNEIPSYTVYNSNNIIAILDKCPINEGHLLVIPFEEIEDINELEESRYHELWKAVRHLSGILKIAFQSPKIGIAVEGFGVPHVHVHLVPVYSGNELNPERAVEATADELSAAMKKIIGSSNI